MTEDPKPAATPDRREDPTAGEPMEVDPFLLLVGGLGAQVQVALGLIPDPVTKEARKELPAARQGIDMLAALEAKTKGNLEEQEAKFLSALLAQVRMQYVEASRDSAGDA